MTDESMCMTIAQAVHLRHGSRLKWNEIAPFIQMELVADAAAALAALRASGAVVRSPDQAHWPVTVHVDPFDRGNVRQRATIVVKVGSELFHYALETHAPILDDTEFVERLAVAGVDYAIRRAAEPLYEQAGRLILEAAGKAVSPAQPATRPSRGRSR